MMNSYKAKAWLFLPVVWIARDTRGLPKRSLLHCFYSHTRLAPGWKQQECWATQRTSRETMAQCPAQLHLEKLDFLLAKHDADC